MKVLVVDDDKEIVDSIAIFLSGENYEVLKAYNGIEALEILNENEVYLMILDIMMPEMSGIEVVREVRRDSQLPILILSILITPSEPI